LASVNRDESGHPPAQPPPAGPAAARRPRILRAVSRMSIGGVQRGILATLARADHARFEYGVLCTKKPGHWADAVRELGVALTCQKTLPPWDPYQILRLARVLRRLRPDLIHIHMAPMVIPVGTAARLAGIRHIVIQHHNDYARHWDELNLGLRRWEFLLTRRANAVIAVSRAVARMTAARVGLADGGVEVIPNGIDRETFETAAPVDPRAEWRVAPDRPLVVHVARYLPTKRIEDFIEAAAIVAGRWGERHPDRPMPVFAAIGGGAPDLAEAYQRLIRHHKLERTVILAGSRPDVPGLLKAAQLGVLASEMEGFGQVVMEYLAAGLPVVATNLDCIGEMLRDGEEALLVPTRAPQALADAIETLLSDAELARRLTQAGRRKLEVYDWGRAVRAYEAIYDRILQGSPAAG